MTIPPKFMIYNNKLSHHLQLCIVQTESALLSLA
jgi:hypothetical protein